MAVRSASWVEANALRLAAEARAGAAVTAASSAWTMSEAVPNSGNNCRT